jgi:hypothetical protein
LTAAAVLVPREFLYGLLRQHERDLAGLYHLFKSGQRRLMAIILRDIQPHTRVN